MKKNEQSALFIGAGLASTSLVLALLERGFDEPIAILEKEHAVSTKKTWCFWGEDAIPAYLKPLIAKQWSHWQVSSEKLTIEQSSFDRRSHYCCIKADDFYQFAQERFTKAKNVVQLFGHHSQVLPPHNNRVCVQTNDAIMTGKYGFTSHYAPPDTLENGLFQCFSGAWISVDRPYFNADVAGLMLNLKTMNNIIQFTYVLPIDSTHALLERTYFSPNKADLHAMQLETELYLKSQFGENGFNVAGWEQGILPMSIQLSKHSQMEHGWHKIGIAGGMMRASTGYAFLPIQRWCQSASAAMVNGKPLKNLRKGAISSIYQRLDEVFLKVLNAQPALGPELFLRMVQHTNSQQFSNFMTECAKFGDMLAVIRAMPKLPFMRALV